MLMRIVTNKDIFNIRVPADADRDTVHKALGRALCRRYRRQYVATKRADYWDAHSTTYQITLGNSLYSQTRRQSDRGTTTDLLTVWVTL